MTPRPPQQPSRLDLPGLAALLAAQDGVIARHQVLALGGVDHEIRARLRGRLWATVHPGVYVDHTGPITWRQRAWAAVLLCWPAALAGQSALRWHGFRAARPPSDVDQPVRVVVDPRQHPVERPGLVVERVQQPRQWLAPGSGPPRVTVEHAALKAASRRSEPAAVALLGEVCQARLTTPARLVEAIDRLPRLPQRATLRAILADVAEGAHSVLERRYLLDVERRHRLPRGSRQVPAKVGKRAAYRDVRYAAQTLVVELDGRLGHELPQDRWADLTRDIAAAIDGELTVRLGWGQVLEPCRVAEALGRLLRRRGWTGEAAPCGPGCHVGDPDRSSPSDGDDPSPSPGGNPLDGGDGVAS